MAGLARTLTKIAALKVLLFSFGSAMAQRGADFTESAPPQTLPGAGFPGMFDSRMTEPRKFSLDIPSLSADYGINDRLSIGTNGWAAAALVVGTPLAYTKIRYRFFSTSEISSVHTVYLGGASNGFSKSATKTSAFLFGLSNNTSFLVGDSGEITSTLFYSNIYYSQEESETKVYSKASIGLLLAGVTYQNWITDWFGPSAMVLLAPYLAVDADSSGGTVSAVVQGGQFFIVRGSAEFMAGKSWLLSPGIYSFVSLSAGANAPVTFPIFSAAVKW